MIYKIHKKLYVFALQKCHSTSVSKFDVLLRMTMSRGNVEYLNSHPHPYGGNLPLFPLGMMENPCPLFYCKIFFSRPLSILEGKFPMPFSSLSPLEK